jgi:hypothetical protein
VSSTCKVLEQKLKKKRRPKKKTELKKLEAEKRKETRAAKKAQMSRIHENIILNIQGT